MNQIDENTKREIEMQKAISGLSYDEELLKTYKANFNKSFKNAPAKKKKIKLNKKGKSALAILTALVIAPGAISAVKHIPFIERQNNLNDAKKYMEEEVIPEILAENNIDVISSSDGGYYISDFDIEELNVLESSLVDTGYFDYDMARFAMMENFGYSEVICNVLGYDDVNAYLKSLGYKNLDQMDDLVNSPMSMYINQHEVGYVEDVNNLRDARNLESEANTNAR